MQAMGKDAARPRAETAQGLQQGRPEGASQVFLGPLRPLEPVSVHARVLLAIERARKLHAQHIEVELLQYEAAWLTLPLEEVSAGPERLKWLEERTESLVGTVNHAWDKRYAGLPGAGLATALARMRLLESLLEIVVQRDTWLARAALARKALGRSKPGDDELLERVEPEARRRGEAAAAEDSEYGDWAAVANWQGPSAEHTASAARSLFNAQYPDYDNHLPLVEWMKALRAFERGPGKRSGGEEKWGVLTSFAEKLGLPPKDPENLKKEWRVRKKAFPSLFPVVGRAQDELHEECSISQLNASTRSGPEQT